MDDPRTKKQRRADMLAAYARRAIFGIRAQQERLDQEPVPAGHDLDFYAFAAWQLREAGRQAQNRLRLDAVSALLDALDSEIPRLREYRNAMTHSLDDGLKNAAWFGQFVVELLPGGGVEYILDTRDRQHDALERFFDGLIEVLEPVCSPETRESHDHARLRDTL